MQRRPFLKLGAIGAAAAFAPGIAWASTGIPIRLAIEPVDYEMIDGKFVYMLFYFDEDDEPHPPLHVREGEPVEFEITNNDTRPHGFAIAGIAGVMETGIAPGETRALAFTAPVGGSYLYYDPMDAPLNRVLGLYGAFIVEPQVGETLAGSPTPFSRSQHNPQIRAVFDAFGSHPRFPGEQWKAGDEKRDKLWLVSDIDSKIHARAAVGDLVTGQALIDAFVPDYFTINGLSGFDTAVHEGTDPSNKSAAEAIQPSNRQGQPTLLRTMHAGLATHSMHIHGNHVFECSDVDAAGNNVLETNIYERDVWMLRPMGRRDMVLPFERPPDAAVWPPKQEPFPMRFVMHCHTEMSQTAGGGNYPQGLVTHWEMTAPL